MAESTSNEYRPPSGHDEDFVEAVDKDFQCLICHLPLKEPVQTRCGHRYCKECLDEHIKRQQSQGQSLTCPFDRQNLDKEDIFPDKATERKILSLAIRCPNVGCKWTGEVRLKEVSTHTKNECRLTMISCPYVQMGCQAKVQRQGAESHLELATRLHLDLVCIKLNNTKVLLDKTRDELKNAMELLKSSSVQHTNAFLWRIDGFSEILKQAKNEGKERIYSDPFYTKTETDGFGYKLRVFIYPNGIGNGKNTHMSVFITIMKGEYDAILPWHFNKKVKLTLIDQDDDPEERENETKEVEGRNIPSFSRPTTEENTGIGFDCFVSHEKLKSQHYIVDDTLFLQVEIRSPPY
ncbi:TNF receptor-associated factor 5-like [Pocillopora damicornis]|uniref:TNF receptor-associated factor 5-like n=1 Tax=Pocillopora damicornis TaxID=46731 RepID=UPI000F54D0EC|nr:TNF receptor-associated factor 5-like [Pocillopora damicornis]